MLTDRHCLANLLIEPGGEMSRSMIAILLVGATQITACGPDCQATCNKLYQPSECGITRPGGFTVNDLTGRCMTECQSAMSKPGLIGDYNPLGDYSSQEVPSLDNDQQAAAWMDCVANASCELLRSYKTCAPVW